MATDTTSQRQWILGELQRGRVLTHLDAENGCGCARIAARINELRKMGHNIITHTRALPNRKRIGAYQLIQTKKEAA